MFGKLSLDAVPFHEPIVMVTIAGIILGGLALVGLITYFGKWTYLWKEWLTSVDHKRLGIMYIIVAIVMLLRGCLLYTSFAHITGFGQRGCVGHGERDVQQARQRFGQQRFTGTGRTDQQNVTFAQLDTIAGIAVAQTFVMVVYRDRQHFFRLFLADNVIVQVVTNFMRRR